MLIPSKHKTSAYNFAMVCLFDLILYVQSTTFQLNRDGSSWVETVLSKDKRVLLKDHNVVTPVRLEPLASRSQVKHSTTEPLRSRFGAEQVNESSKSFVRGNGMCRHVLYAVFVNLYIQFTTVVPIVVRVNLL